MLRAAASGLLTLALAAPAPAADAPAADAPGADAIFLVAGEDLVDPNFERSVVLVTHSEAFAGPLGVIVNRPTKFKLADALPDLPDAAKLEEKVFEGGPVARRQIVFVYRSPGPPAGEEDAVRLIDGVYLGWGAQKLRALLARDRPGEGLRIYAGHAAWAPGQLESEVSRGSWKSARVDARSIFETRSEHLWPELSRRASMTTASAGSGPGATQGGTPWH